MSWRADLQVLREWRYRRLLGARTVSLLGSAIAPIALAFAVLALPHGSASEVGIVLAGRSIAQVLCVLAGGVLADRFSRYRVMVASDMVAGCAQGAVAALFLTRNVSLGPLVALSAVNGAAAGLFYPASSAIVPEVVSPAVLQPANAFIRLASNASTVVGAVLAGLIIAGFGSGWAIAADAVSFAMSAVLLVGLGVRNERARATTSILADLRDGWSEFRSRTWLWVIVAQFAFLNACFSGGINVLGVVVARDHYGGATGFSVLRALQAIGLLVGSFVAVRLRPRRPLLGATVATFAFVPPLLLLAGAAPLWLVAAAMLVDGLCTDIFEVLWSTTLQRHVPLDVLSRVSSYDALGSFALGPVGMAAAGPIADGLGVAETLAAAGILTAAATAAALSSRSVRTLTDGPTPPAPDPDA